MIQRAWGIAGYMGAGKSQAARFLAALIGGVVVDADAVAKEMMAGDRRLIEHLCAEFGPTILEKGRLSFPRLGAVVFRSVEALRRLNRIVHPPLIKKLSMLIHCPRSESYILDAALIPLWNIESWFEQLLWIDAPRSVRIERIAFHSGLQRREIEQRCAVQEALMRAPLAASPWHKVTNDGTLDEFKSSLQKLAAGSRAK